MYTHLKLFDWHIPWLTSRLLHHMYMYVRPTIFLIFQSDWIRKVWAGSPIHWDRKELVELWGERSLSGVWTTEECTGMKSHSLFLRVRMCFAVLINFFLVMILICQAKVDTHISKKLGESLRVSMQWDEGVVNLRLILTLPYVLITQLSQSINKTGNIIRRNMSSIRSSHESSEKLRGTKVISKVRR